MAVDTEQFIIKKIQEGRSVIQIVGDLRDEGIILPYVVVKELYIKLSRKER